MLGGSVWVLAEHMLTRVEVSALPRESDRPLRGTFMPIVPPLRASAETATVAFALPSGYVGLDHPHSGRIVMTRGPKDPAVTRGEGIVLDDVVEELPGVYRVHSWHPKARLDRSTHGARKLRDSSISSSAARR